VGTSCLEPLLISVFSKTKESMVVVMVDITPLAGA
jgi:hypothetical protein